MAARGSRNRRIAGLSIRNGRFGGVLWADRGDWRKTARRFQLLDEDGDPVRASTAAGNAPDVLKAGRREKKRPRSGRKAPFDTFAAEHLEMASTRAKREASRSKGSEVMDRWKAHPARVRLDRIATPVVKPFVGMRLRGGKLGDKTFEAAAPRSVAVEERASRKSQ